MPSFTRRGALRYLGGLAAVGVASRPVAAAGVTTTDRRIESWDGTELATTFFDPGRSGPAPAILMTHGWGGDRSDVAPRATRYAEHGYAVLTYDSRGFGESGGQVNVDGPKEVRDARTLITWLARRDAVLADGDDPVVGMDGESYAGGIQLETAIQDDRLDAIVPRWAWHDLVYSLEPNEVVKDGWGGLLFAYGTTSARGVTDGNYHPDTYDVQGLNPRLDKIIAESTVGNDIPPDDERWLRTRSPVGRLDRIDVPTLLVSGWIDELFTPHEAVANLHGLRAGGVDARLLLFDGGHVASRKIVQTNAHTDAAALDWLDTHLVGDGHSDRPTVEFYDEQTDRYRHAANVPRPGTDRVPVRLGAVSDGSWTPVVNPVVPTSTSDLSPVDADLTPATAAGFDVTLAEGFTAFGAPRAELSIEPLGPGTKLFCKVYHVHDGAATLVDGQVTPVTVPGDAGEVVRTNLDMEPLYRRFAAGDALRFVVATTDAGYFASRTSPGAKIHHTDAHPSVVSVPSFETGAAGDPFATSG